MKGYVRNLFIDEEDEYSLDSVVHLFMSRLHQQYGTVMKMDKVVRNKIFQLELAVIKKEDAAAQGTT